MLKVLLLFNALGAFAILFGSLQVVNWKDGRGPISVQPDAGCQLPARDLRLGWGSGCAPTFGDGSWFLAVGLSNQQVSPVSNTCCGRQQNHWVNKPGFLDKIYA